MPPRAIAVRRYCAQRAAAARARRRRSAMRMLRAAPPPALPLRASHAGAAMPYGAAAAAPAPMRHV